MPEFWINDAQLQKIYTPYYVIVLPPFLLGLSPITIGCPASFQYICEMRKGPQSPLVH